MSNQVFPDLPGLKWDQVKNPIFSTRVQRAVSGRELRAPLMVYPLWEFILSFELLRDNSLNHELTTLMGFYLLMKGANDDFLFIDKSDQIKVGQVIGTGDTVTAAFPMVRTYGYGSYVFTEPITDIQPKASPTPILNIYVNSVLQDPSYYDIKDAAGTVTNYNGGILTFKAGHIPGAYTITADFSYYYRVRFKELEEGSDDSFSQFMHNLWELKKVTLITSR